MRMRMRMRMRMWIEMDRVGIIGDNAMVRRSLNEWRPDGKEGDQRQLEMGGEKESLDHGFLSSLSTGQGAHNWIPVKEDKVRWRRDVAGFSKPLSRGLAAAAAAANIDKKLSSSWHL
jgi:hypothetical protein